jgi:hypothetical protein
VTYQPNQNDFTPTSESSDASAPLRVNPAAAGGGTPPRREERPIADGGTPPPRKERDYRRDYTISIKRVCSAYVIEGGIVAASLTAAWLYAEEYGHDLKGKIMMMLAPVAYGLVELTRVPLAITTRAHPSALMRVVALVAVLGAAGVTVKSMSQLGQMQFQPRLDDVVQKRAALLDAANERATITQRIVVADAEIATTRDVYDKAQARVTAAGDGLTKLPARAPCRTVTTTRADSSSFQRVICPPSDDRTKPMAANLDAAKNDATTAKTKLETAMAARDRLDPAVADGKVTAAEIALRDAIHHSQLHSFAGMLFGKDGMEVTDGEINTVLRIFVFPAAIFVSLSSTFLAMTAVVPIKKKAPVEIPDDGMIKILKPMYEEAKKRIAEEAAKNLAAELANESAKASKPVTAKKDEPAPPEDGEVIDLLRKLKENRDGRHA